MSDSIPVIPPYLDVAEASEEDSREDIVEKCLAAMESGASLNLVAMVYGQRPSDVWRWIIQNPEYERKYEEIKKVRSRAIIEHALYEIQSSHTLDTIKIAERRAKYYLMIAAKLNPKEFSDRMHSPIHGNKGNNAPVSFVLNFGGGEQRIEGRQSVELKAIPQPEDGD